MQEKIKRLPLRELKKTVGEIFDNNLGLKFKEEYKDFITDLAKLFKKNWHQGIEAMSVCSDINNKIADENISLYDVVFRDDGFSKNKCNQIFLRTRNMSSPEAVELVNKFLYNTLEYKEKNSNYEHINSMKRRILNVLARDERDIMDFDLNMYAKEIALLPPSDIRNVVIFYEKLKVEKKQNPYTSNEKILKKRQTIFFSKNSTQKLKRVIKKYPLEIMKEPLNKAAIKSYPQLLKQVEK